MKKPLLRYVAGAFLALSPTLLNAQTIFEQASRVTPKVETGYLTDGILTTTVAQNKWDQLVADYAKYNDTSSPTITDTYWTYGDGRVHDTYNIKGYFNNCNQKSRLVDGQVEYYMDCYEVTGGASAQGVNAQQKSCPPENNTTHTAMQKYLNQDTCFDPVELSELDSCPESTNSMEYVIPASGSTKENVCVHNQSGDGSVCSYSLSQDGTYYTATFENTGCYDQIGNDIPEPVQPDPTNYCTSLGDGTVMCTENPDAKCDSSGVCQSGCGSYSFAGQTEFVCFDQDTDGDGVPNYSDLDIDGDGIPNSEDEDWDGDGSNDPAYNGDSGSGSGGSGTTIDLSATNSLLSTANNNLGAIKSGITDLKNSLVKDQDFDGISNEYGSKLDQTTTELDNAVDGAQDFDFKDAVTQSSMATSFDSAIAALGNSTCANPEASFGTMTISIPACESADYVRPYFYWLLAFSTAIFCFYRITTTITGGKN